jgi:hypothetical protein
MAKGKGFFRTVALMFDRNAAKRMEEEAAESLARAGKDGAEELARELDAGGKRAARALAKSLRDEYNNTLAAGRLDLAKGVIDAEQFAAIEREAKRTFNAQLIPTMEKLRAEGKLTDAEFANLSRSVKRVGDEGEKDLGLLGKSLEWVKGKALAAAAAVGALFALNKIRQFGEASIRAALDAQESAQRLFAVWRANSGAVGRTFEELISFGSRMKWETLFGEDVVQRAMSQLLTYKSIQGDTFERTVSRGGDMASVFGGLEQSVAALARALDDPIAGLGQLRKAGYTFEDSVVAQIKALTEQGKLFEAQRIILGELEKEVGGVAKGLKTGWVAAVDNMGKAWLGFKERTGEALLAAGGGISVIETLTASIVALTEWVEENRGAVTAVTDSVATFGKMVLWLIAKPVNVLLVSLQGWILLVDALGDALGALLNGGLSLLQGSLAKLAEGFAWALEGAGAFARFIGGSGLSEAARNQAASLRAWAKEMRDAAAVSREAAKENLANIGAPKGAGASAAQASTSRTGGGTVDQEAMNAALREEISLLKQASSMRILGEREVARAAELERTLRDQLARGNLSLADRVRIQGHINDLEAVRKTEAGRAVAETREELGLLERTSRVRRLSAEETARARELEADLRQALTQSTLTRAEQLDIEEEILKVRGLLRTAVDDEISALREAAGLRALTAEEQARALVLEDQIAAQLKDATGDLAEQNRLQAQLNTLRGLALAPAEREIALLGQTARLRTLSRDEVERLRIREAELRAQIATAQSVEEEIRLRGLLADTRDILADIPSLANAMQDGLGNAITNTAGAFEQFFSALAVGFDATEAGFNSVGEAAKGVGLAMIGGLTDGMAQYHLAQAAGKFAEGTWPPNPAAIAAAMKHTAAAGLFKALGSLATPSRGGSGMPTAPGGVGLRAGQEAARHGPEVHLHMYGDFDMLNPEVQRVTYGATQYATDRYGEGARVTSYRHGRG